MKQLLKRILLAGAVIFLAAQAFRPDRTNPASDPAMSIRQDPSVDPAVIDLLSRSCMDCHSNETRWPWYTTITPVNFLVARDVDEGRKRLNLSMWLSHSAARRASQLESAYDEVSEGEMPLAPYTLLHPDAKWSPDETKLFLAWAAATQDSLMGSMEEPE